MAKRLNECPVCHNEGSAFPFSRLSIGSKDIHYQRCNGCGFTTIDIEELNDVLDGFERRISDLESEIDDLK